MIVKLKNREQQALPMVDFQDDGMYLPYMDKGSFDFLCDSNPSLFDDMLRIPPSELRVNAKPVEESEKMLAKTPISFDDIFDTPKASDGKRHGAFESAASETNLKKRKSVTSCDVDYLSSDTDFEESAMCLNGCGKRQRVTIPQKSERKRPPANHMDLPPRVCVLEDVVHAVNQVNKCGGNNVVRFIEHPPLEVRTRTKKEKRNFSCQLVVSKKALAQQQSPVIATVSLVYATDFSTTLDILGGTLEVPVSKDGLLEFNDLTISVASPKHDEREFCLCVTLNICPDMPVYSRAFYGFSHKSVLKRRKDIDLRAISGTSGTVTGGTATHVVGSPFVKSERLEVVFRVKKSELKRTNVDWKSEKVIPVPEIQLKNMYNDLLPEKCDADDSWISISAKNIEWYSDSVIFFETPDDFAQATDDVWTFVQVTNDNRYFSKPLPFVFKKKAP